MLRWLKSVPRPHSAGDCRLPWLRLLFWSPAGFPSGLSRAAGRARMRSRPCWGPPGAAGRRAGRPGRRPRGGRGVTVVVRPLTPGRKADSHYFSGAAAKLPGRWKFPQKLFLKGLGVSKSQSFAGFPNLTAPSSFLRVALVYLSFLFIRSCERVATPAKRFRKRNHFSLP